VSHELVSDVRLLVVVRSHTHTSKQVWVGRCRARSLRGVEAQIRERIVHRHAPTRKLEYSDGALEDAGVLNGPVIVTLESTVCDARHELERGARSEGDTQRYVETGLQPRLKRIGRQGISDPTSGHDAPARASVVDGASHRDEEYGEHCAAVQVSQVFNRE
jgi:hypothetical protein